MIPVLPLYPSTERSPFQTFPRWELENLILWSKSGSSLLRESFQTVLSDCTFFTFLSLLFELYVFSILTDNLCREIDLFNSILSLLPGNSVITPWFLIPVHYNKGCGHEKNQVKRKHRPVSQADKPPLSRVKSPLGKPFGDAETLASPCFRTCIIMVDIVQRQKRPCQTAKRNNPKNKSYNKCSPFFCMVWSLLYTSRTRSLGW